MIHTYVCSGAVYDLCYAISSEEGKFTADQVALLNANTGNTLGVTEVQCWEYFRTGYIYLVSTPGGGIPCDPEEKLRRSYELIPPRYGDK